MVLLIDLVLLARLSLKWESDETELRSIIDSLETAAARAEFRFPKFVPRRNRHLRSRARYRGHQIATVIRALEEQALSVTLTRREDLTESLLNALRHVIREDWDQFLVLQPEPATRSLVRRYAPRVGLALLLVLLAFLLPPILPAVITDPVSFQATVLVVAGFSLLSPDVQKAADVVKSFGSRKG
jgi:hypothetical protein